MPQSSSTRTHDLRNATPTCSRLCPGPSCKQSREVSKCITLARLVMNAFAKCLVRKSQTMHVLGDILASRTAELSPQNVTNIVHAFSRLSCYNVRLFQNLVTRVSSEDLKAYKLYELGVLCHNLAKLRSGGPTVYAAMFGELARRPAEDWEPKAVAQVLDAMRRRSAFSHEQLLVLLFRCFFGNLDAYPVHPLTQASWCFVELDALNLAKDLCPDLPSDESTQGFPEGRFAMRRVFERLEDLNARNTFTPTQRCHVQQLIRAYRYRFELDYGLMPQKVKSFCKSQFDISNSVALPSEDLRQTSLENRPILGTWLSEPELKVALVLVSFISLGTSLRFITGWLQVAAQFNQSQGGRIQELQEKFYQLKASIDDSEEADPEVLNTLHSIEQQMEELKEGNQNLEEAKQQLERSRESLDAADAAWTATCFALATQSLGFTREIMSSFERLVANDLPPEEAAELKLYRMVNVCIHKRAEGGETSELALDLVKQVMAAMKRGKRPPKMPREWADDADSEDAATQVREQSDKLWDLMRAQ
ncbi:unnamed protein product, partial [Symbiodinium sp. CCMP2592]